MSSFWTVFWSLVATFAGVFAAAYLAWEIEKRKDRRVDRERARRLTQVLVGGLERNIVVLRRMRQVVAGDNGSPPACPSQAIQRGHFDATIVSGVTLLESRPEMYGELLNASYATAHINRRVEVLGDLESMVIESHKPPQLRKEGKARIDAHYKEIETLIDRALPMCEAVLLYLGGEIPTKESWGI